MTFQEDTQEDKEESARALCTVSVSASLLNLEWKLQPGPSETGWCPAATVCKWQHHREAAGWKW